MIPEIDIIGGLGWIIGLIAGGLISIMTYIWSGDRKRLSLLEEDRNKFIPRIEAETMVQKVSQDLSSCRTNIVGVIDKRYDEIRADIRELRDLFIRPWNGRERRDKDS